MMRVCFICNQIAAWGKIGGFGTNTRRLGRALAAEGIDVHVVVPRRAGQRRVEQLDGMTVHGQTTWEVLFGKRIYRDIDADIYHTEEPNIGLHNARQAMPRRVHLVTSMDPRDREDWRIELRNATWSRRFKYPLQRFYEDGTIVHRAVRRADGVYVEASFLKNKTQRVYRLATAPGLLPKPIEIPTGSFSKSDVPLCVFLGRFDPRKRPETFFQIVQRMPHISFVAIGRAHDATYQNHLKKKYFHLANLRITDFVDPFQNNALSQMLARAWILVHPAAREGLPTAFQEASVHEMAILAHVNPGGYVERFGKVVPATATVDTWCRYLQEMIDSGTWRESAKTGRQWNAEHHAISVSVDAHFNVYRQQLGQSARLRAA